MIDNYEEKVYAGVLGKIIGVFYGRPIEGWPYEKIKDRFDMVDHFVAKDVGVPLHVADDDLSGTFTFFNALEDYPLKKLGAAEYGNTWLNYLIEEKTVFWWGGLGRSTEHTAYLRLKSGIKAPESGKIKLNGRAAAEQIGAQIFIDAIPLVFAGDVENARKYTRMQAQVSHDGVAVESACFWAGMEAAAFRESNLEALLEENLSYVNSKQLKEIFYEIIGFCKEKPDFRTARKYLEERWGYDKFPGNCHVIPNTALMLTVFLLGKDSFRDAMQMCVSAGWDTDCNGANIGCLNGIRLGLNAITKEFDFRSPIADRFYNISSNGGECVTDAVQQTKRILRMHNQIYQTAYKCQPQRYTFDYKGALQGFEPCPVRKGKVRLSNQQGKALEVTLQEQGKGFLSVPVMWQREDIYGGYCLLGSPVLYETQKIHVRLKTIGRQIKFRLYVIYYNFDDEKQVMESEIYEGNPGWKEFVWQIPPLGGKCIDRMGIEVMGEAESQVLICSVDFLDAPSDFLITGSLRNYDLGRANMQLQVFTSSAKGFSFDARHTFAVSHHEGTGLATIGTKDWKNYQVSCKAVPYLHEEFGLVIRSRGHRKYYALLLKDHSTACLIRQDGDERVILAECSFSYEELKTCALSLRAEGSRICAAINGVMLLSAEDEKYQDGGCGFFICEGTFMADDFHVTQDKFYPEFHYRPPKNWINDPNGLIYKDGWYHMFYQYNPRGDVWGDIHWGHAKSRDLLHWEECPVALVPSYEEGELHCYSGCAVEKENQIYLFYTSVGEKERGPEHGAQQWCAVGDKELNDWKKIGKPALPNELRDSISMWRDPFIWKEEEYFMLLSGTYEKKGCVALYRSPDLKTWSYCSVLYVSSEYELLECPNMLKFGEKYALLYAPLEGTRYCIGELNKDTWEFTVHSEGVFDYSIGKKGFYAPNTYLTDPKGRYITIGCLFEWDRMACTYHRGWAGMQSLPREVFLKGDGLHIRLIKECESLRKKELYSLKPAASIYPRQGKVLAACRKGEICCKVKLAENDSFAVRVFVSLEEKEYTELRIDRALHSITLDRSRSTEDENVGTEEIKVPVSGDACEYGIDMILDYSSVEVFINERYTISARVFPDNVYGGITISKYPEQGAVEEIVIYELGL